MNTTQQTSTAVPAGWICQGEGKWTREHPTLDLLISKKGDEFQVFIHDRHEASRRSLGTAAQFVDDVLSQRIAKTPIVAGA